MENSNKLFEFMSQNMDCQQLNEIQTINEKYGPEYAIQTCLNPYYIHLENEQVDNNKIYISPKSICNNDIWFYFMDLNFNQIQSYQFTDDKFRISLFDSSSNDFYVNNNSIYLRYETLTRK